MCKGSVPTLEKETLAVVPSVVGSNGFKLNDVSTRPTRQRQVLYYVVAFSKQDKRKQK